MKRALLVLFVLAIGFLTGFAFSGGVGSQHVERTAPDTGLARPAPTPVARTVPAAQPAAVIGVDFTDVAARAVPTVTNISSMQAVRRRNSPFANDPFFQFFFGDQDMFGGRCCFG